MSDEPLPNEEIKDGHIYTLGSASRPDIQLVVNSVGKVIGMAPFGDFTDPTSWKLLYNKESRTYALENCFYHQRYLQRTGEENNSSGYALVGTSLQFSRNSNRNDPSCQWDIHSYTDRTFRIFAPGKAPGVAVELSSDNNITLNVMTDASLWHFYGHKHWAGSGKYRPD